MSTKKYMSLIREKTYKYHKYLGIDENEGIQSTKQG
jgi:hypothetical protein